MAQAGGSAAINGFLYQILHHLGWLADVTLKRELAGLHEVKAARIVLEPRDGGDARCETAAVRLTEQYKARSRGNTWSLRQVVTKVLRDLRKAVPEPPDRRDLYRFVTDGRVDQLVEFAAFLDRVRQLAQTGDGPADLDGVRLRSFGAGLPTTDRGLFAWIVKETWSPSEGKRARGDERATVFHLLARFSMQGAVRADERARDVDRLLRRYAPDLGDEAGTRARLVGILVDRLSRGEVHLTADELDALLEDAGLNPGAMRNLARLAETAAVLAEERARDFLRYRPELDVREAPIWPSGKPVLLIAGDSGAGKSWQLGALTARLARERHPMALVTRVGSDEQILADATSVIWQEALGFTNEKTPPALTMHYRAMAPRAPMPWLTIAVDDVQDEAVAQNLVGKSWTRWGMRLAMTLPLPLAQALEGRHPELVQVHPLDRFTVDEADTYLRRGGRRWSDLPNDLQDLLRTPILAGIYAELPHASIRTSPCSEYEICERFWEERIRGRGDPRQSPHHQDEAIVLDLADAVLDGRPYPWPGKVQRDALLDGAALRRLERIGWLRRAEGGEAAFGHDRLLNWAVAELIVHRFRRSCLRTADLPELLIKCARSPTEDFPRQLRYVPMDVLWLLAENNDRARLLAGLAKELEVCRQEFGSHGKGLYLELLPTLGRRAVSILMARLDMLLENTAEHHSPVAQFIAKGLSVVAGQEGADLAAELGALLNASDLVRQDTAMVVLANMPDGRFLDRLWALHQERLRRLEHLKSVESHLRSEQRSAALEKRMGRLLSCDRSTAALQTCIGRDPDWLRRRILDADPAREPVAALAELLHGLDHSEAATLWEEVKGALMAKVQPDRPAWVLFCIRRFADRGLLPFVYGWLEGEDNSTRIALGALARLDPDAALQRLVQIPPHRLAAWRLDWLSELLRSRRQETLRCVRQIAEHNAVDRSFLRMLFAEHIDQADAAILRQILAGLETDLRAHSRQGGDCDPSWVFSSLRLLARITRPDLLAVLEEQAGGELERMITSVALSRVRGSRLVLDSARQVLIRIGGTGITELVNRELEHPEFGVRRDGLAWAVVGHDVRTVELLTAIACRPVPADEVNNPTSQLVQEQYEATLALAALGEDEGLIRAIWESGVPYAASDLVELRGTDRPMDRALTARARSLLAATGVQGEEDLVRAVTTAWLSADPDFTEPVRRLLLRSDPNGGVAGLACIALQQLGDRSDEFVAGATRLLSTAENKLWAMNALLSVGTDDALDRLAGHLRSRPAPDWGEDEQGLIRALWHHERTRAFAAEAAARLCRERIVLHPPWDIAAEADDPGIKDLVVTEAFREWAFTPDSVPRAIEGLAKLDRERAVEAAECALRHHPSMERRVCRLLARIAPEKAAESLVGAALSVGRKSLIPAVGRVLRQLDAAPVDRLLAERMADTRSDVRAVAAELAGWLPPGRLADRLAELAERETASRVRDAVLNSLARHRQEQIVRDLFGKFSDDPPEHHWSTLFAILDSGDPFLLEDQEDPLWLGHILADTPFVYTHRATAALNSKLQ